MLIMLINTKTNVYSLKSSIIFDDSSKFYAENNTGIVWYCGILLPTLFNVASIDRYDNAWTGFIKR